MVTLKNKELYFIALNDYQHRFLLSVAFTFLCNILSICFKQTKISLLLLSTNSFYIGPQIRVPFGFSESEISDLIDEGTNRRFGFWKVDNDLNCDNKAMDRTLSFLINKNKSINANRMARIWVLFKWKRISTKSKSLDTIIFKLSNGEANSQFFSLITRI